MTPGASMGSLLSVGNGIPSTPFAANRSSTPGTSASGQHPGSAPPSPSLLKRQATQSMGRAPWSLHNDKPKWWIPDAIEIKAIDGFDTRHRAHQERAARATTANHRDPTSMRKERSLDLAIWELGHNRFFLQEALAGAKRYEKKVKQRKKKIWKMVDSIWGPRRKGGDAKDFYDTPAVKHAAFNCDWNLGVERMKLDKKAERAAKVGLGAEAAESARPMLRQGMEEHKDILYQMFDFYGKEGNDIFSISITSFLQFVRDAGLINEDVEGQRSQDLQLIFDAANASATKDDVYNAKRSLNRMEFIGVLAQLILERHVKGGGLDPIEACRKFFREDIIPRLPRQCFQDSNSFRADFCYKEEVDMELKKHEESLRNIFTSFAYGTGAIGDAVLSTKLMDGGEYSEFISRIDLVDAFITQREVRLAFLWSRMLVVDENSLKGRSSVLQLRFEDFLEVLVRLAYQSAMPNEEDLEKANVNHAGEYLQWLSGYAEEEKRFKKERTRELGQALDQPLELKLRHFLNWLIFAVQGGKGLDKVSPKDADKFKNGLIARLRRDAAEGEAAAAANVFKEEDDGDDDEAEIGYARKQDANAPTMLGDDSTYRSQTTLQSDQGAGKFEEAGGA